MKTRTGPIAWLVYVAVRMSFAVMQMFPIDWNLRTAKYGSRVWKKITRRHFDRAVKNLTDSFGDSYTHEQIEQLADRCLESWAMFAVEAICLPRLMSRLTWSRYITPEGVDELVDLMVGGKGIILVTGHYGSFEVPGHLVASLGFHVTAIMRPLDNVYLNRFLVESRKKAGLSLLDKKGAAASAESLLREGAMIAFIGDQDAGRKGVFVDFFGRPASTYKSIGLLAMTTKTPIAVGYARRVNDKAKYVVGVNRIIYPHEWEDQADPLTWVTQEYTAAIEGFIREHPDQYLWIHRRWKSVPKRRRSK